ncbi:unnamed protein product [Ilex paraguariensis]|uniref:Uncharacterized protein n=1 Tax=Ilex paraguariensis TaxID=185542 RepID=A0ABC8TS64_9AQUA
MNPTNFSSSPDEASEDEEDMTGIQEDESLRTDDASKGSQSMVGVEDLFEEVKDRFYAKYDVFNRNANITSEEIGVIVPFKQSIEECVCFEPKPDRSLSSQKKRLLEKSSEIVGGYGLGLGYSEFVLNSEVVFVFATCPAIYSDELDLCISKSSPNFAHDNHQAV